MSTNFDDKLLEHIRLDWDDSLASTIADLELYKASDDWGTLLHYAAFYGNDAAVRHLVHLGSDVDSLGGPNCHRTPLMVAVARDHIKAVKSLLEAGADIDLVNPEGTSALRMVFDSRYFEPHTLRAFLDRARSETSSTDSLIGRLVEAGCSLYHAAALRDVDLLKSMLSRGLDVNSRGYHGKSALHAAAEMNDPPMTSMLIDSGADVNAVDDDGTTALFIAASRGLVAVVRLLLENGADPNLKDRDSGGATPFFAVYADGTEEERFDECAELLLRHGAVPENSPGDPHTLLDHALFQRSSVRIKMLIAHVALMEMRMKGERTFDETIMRCRAEEHDEEYAQFRDYYEVCRQVLGMRIAGGATVLDLMSESDGRMRVRARNWRLVPAVYEVFVERNLSEEFAYYYGVLCSRVSRAVKAVKLEDGAIEAICDIFGSDSNAGYVFAREVVGYLGESDLERLCKV